MRQDSFRLIVLALVAGLLSVHSRAQTAWDYSLNPLTGGMSDFSASYTGNYGPARTATVRPIRMDIDQAGNIFLAEDTAGGTVRKITPAGAVLPITGIHFRTGGDGGPSALATFRDLTDLAVATDGSVYVLEFETIFESGVYPPKRHYLNSIRVIAPAGTISTLATIESADSAVGLDVDAEGNVFMATRTYVWKVTPDGTVVVIAGTGEYGSDGSGGAAVSASIYARALDMDQSGNLHLLEFGGLVRVIRPDGTIEDVFAPDDPPQPNEHMRTPDLAVDAEGNIYIADGPTIMHVDPAGTARILHESNDPLQFSRDLLFPTLAFTALALDATGNVYAADVSRVYLIDSNGNKIAVTTCGFGGCNGDSGPSLFARLSDPADLARDAHGNLYIADTGNHRVRKISADGIMSTLAGTGQEGFSGDGGPATQASLNHPWGVEVDSFGNVYIADSGNHRVRRVTPDGRIETVAGNGEPTFSGDDGPATSASLNLPLGLAVDPGGNVYIADYENSRVRRVSTEGVITTYTGTGIPGYSGDGGPASEAMLMNPIGLDCDSDGNLFIADYTGYRIRRVTSEGIIATFAGTGQRGEIWWDVPATEKTVYLPLDVSAGRDGTVYITSSSITEEYALRAVDIDGIFRRAIERLPGGNTSYGHDVRAVEAASDGELVLAAPIPRTGPRNGGRLWTATRGISQAPAELPEIYSTSPRNGASFVFGAVAPGQIISVFGERLGPAEGVGAGVAEGFIGTEIDGTRILFDGLPAPILYAQSRQINAIVPYALAGRGTVTVQVERHGRLSNEVGTPVVVSAPGVFTWEGPQSGALNQDHTLNGRDNPAHPGEIIVLYATGAGETDPPGQDGKLAIDELPRPLLPISVEIGGQPAEVIYAGAAPNFVAGALQINARIPDDPEEADRDLTHVIIRVANTPSQVVSIFID